MPPCRASLTQNRSLICKQWALHDGFWRFLSSYFLLASSMCYKTKCKMQLIIIKSHGPYFSSLNPYPINCASCALANMKSPLWHLLTHQAGIDAVLILNWTKGGDSAYTLGRIMNGRHHDFVYMILCTREMLISCCISTQHTLLSLQSRVLANKKDIEDGCGLNRKEGQPIWTLRLSPNATQIQTENQENLRPGW